jgi:hypothetical protein
VPAVLIFILLRRRAKSGSLSIGIPFGLGSATFDLTPTDRIVAWKLHVQMVTRKAALPFDEEHDVVADVLSSLFDLFQITRDLLLELPPSDRAKEESVANLIIRVLNDGIRPSLTKWHSDYRRWWDAALANVEYASRSPSDIQKDYPKYADLLRDLQRMNVELSKFSDELALVAAGVSARRRRRIRIRPQAPSLTPVASAPETKVE